LNRKIAGVKHVAAHDETFEFSAAPYEWPHGLGVQIDISLQDQRVALVLVLCSRDLPEFDALNALSQQELCDVALSRFAARELSVTLETALLWQKQIGSLGYDYVSPLYTGFSAGNAPAL
jgi:hypothetical protein